MGNTTHRNHPKTHPKRWEGAYIEEIYTSVSAKVHFVGCAGTGGYDEDIELSQLDLSVDFRHWKTGLWRSGKLDEISKRRVTKVKSREPGWLGDSWLFDIDSNADVAPLHTYTLAASELYVGKLVDALVHPYGKNNKLWLEAKIQNVQYARFTRTPEKVLVHYMGHNEAWDEWVPPTPEYIARHLTYSDTSRFHLHTSVRVLVEGSYRWKKGTIQKFERSAEGTMEAVVELEYEDEKKKKTTARFPLNSPRLVLDTGITYVVPALPLIPRDRASPSQRASVAGDRSWSDATPLSAPHYYENF